MLALAMVITACQQDKNIASLPGTNQLLEINTLEKVSGSTIENGVPVAYTAFTKDEGIQVELQVNGKEIEYFANLIDLNVRRDGHDNSLTRAELTATSRTLDKLGAALNPTYTDETKYLEYTVVETTLMGCLSHLSDAPEAYPLGKIEKSASESTADQESRDYQVIYINPDGSEVEGSKPTLEEGTEEKQFGDDGYRCIQKNNSYWFYFDDSMGFMYALYPTVNVDDNVCRGRCGAGCSLYNNWTYDCAEHDWCIFYFGGSTGPGSANCGDEYDDAMDDYVIGALLFIGSSRCRG